MDWRDIKVLTDPMECQGALDIEGVPSPTLVGYLRSILQIRQIERFLAKRREAGDIGGPVHLGVGQEAVAVGVSATLRATDRVFGAHRSHSHVLALGSSVHKLFAEVLGKDTGLSRGMGGSMHLWDGPRGFFGSVPIVAGTVPLAVGAGIAAKMQDGGDVSVSYLGDGAMEEGAVHESLNLARMLRTPTVFVVENNLFSSHMHIDLRQPYESTARFAEAHDIPFSIIDGNDVVAVARAAAEMVEKARNGDGPGFIEAITYRWYGHVDWREDVDVGVNRSNTDLANWKLRDPVRRLESAMTARGIWSDRHRDAMLEKLDSELSDAWARAVADPYPDQAALLSRVYSE